MNLKERWQSSVILRWSIYGLLFGLFIGILDSVKLCHALDFFKTSLDYDLFCDRISIFSAPFEIFFQALYSSNLSFFPFNIFFIFSVLFLILPFFILTISLFYLLIGFIIGSFEKKNITWFKWGIFGVLIAFILWILLLILSNSVIKLVNIIQLYFTIILPAFIIGASISRIIEKIKGKDYFINNLAKKMEYIFLIFLLFFLLIFFIMNYYGWYTEVTLLYKANFHPLGKADCDSIPNTTTRFSYYVSCYKDKVILRKTGFMCELIGKPNIFKSSCYKGLAILESQSVDNPDECASLDLDPYSEVDCYRNLAVKQRNLSICDIIDDSIKWGNGNYDAGEDRYLRQGCYRGVAMEEKNESLCLKISNNDIKDICFKVIAAMKGNDTICLNIINSSKRDNCIRVTPP
ncbi:hypothetical protein HYW74_03695 [Candidatus Pacearchaeota archaeon]|nr:hypothetical protein [Candidatus Pacearchaeota archaeon]